MGVSAIINNGEIVKSQTQVNTEKEAEQSSSTVNKTDFMNLLVAQMKNQDPLEPTSNTEWVSQYATFSELEQMQNVANSSTLQRASDLVGQEVVVNSTDSSGNTTQVQGKVDYVTFSGSKAYLTIDGVQYSIDDLVQVVNGDYSDATSIAESWIAAYEELPKLSSVTLADKDAILALANSYNAMTSYQQSFIPSGYADVLEQYVARISELSGES
ncbi:MAG: flagellar hook capping protein [Lachnospiraceae bacterium]|nr:flagellar hook capping protein [Lachnospiraceae bacterium]